MLFQSDGSIKSLLSLVYAFEHLTNAECVSSLRTQVEIHGNINALHNDNLMIDNYFDHRTKDR